MDRQVLRFYGYFKETCVESKLETERVRKLIIYYYLEDNSIEMVNKTQTNSGLPQGEFLKRHKILRNDGTGLHLDVEDFVVG